MDDTFRRRRLILAGGSAAGVAIALAATALVSGFTSAGEPQPPAWPDGGSPGPQTTRMTSDPSSWSPTGSPAGSVPAAPGAAATPVPEADGAGHRPQPTGQTPALPPRRGGIRW